MKLLLLALLLTGCVSQPQPEPMGFHVSVLWDKSMTGSSWVPWQATTGDDKVLVHTEGQRCQIRMHPPVRKHDPVARSVLGAGLYLCTQNTQGTPFTEAEQAQTHTFVWLAEWARVYISVTPGEMVRGMSQVGANSVKTVCQYPTSIDDFAAIEVLGHEAWHYFGGNFHGKINPRKFNQSRRL